MIDPCRTVLRRCHAGILMLVIFAFVSEAGAQTSGISNFDIRIPDKSGDYGVFRVSATITLNDDPAGGITINVTHPEGGAPTALSAAPGGGPDSKDVGSGSPLDTITLTPPAGGLPAGDPDGFRYTLDITVSSNLDFSTSPGICPDTLPGAEDWAIEITGAVKATGVCLVTYDLDTPGAECFDTTSLQSEDPAEVASVVVGSTPAAQLCGLLRPAADVMLVLDRSGSMDSLTLGSASRPKFEALRDAVDDFVDVWSDLRSTEDSPPADRIGLVFFDSNEEVAVPLGSFATSSNTVVTEVNDECGGPSTTNCSGSTSMGDGLEAAVGEFNFSDADRKVILLMSNGKENAATRVTVDNSSTPTEVLLYETDPNVTVPLFGAGEDARIYAVTVGTSTAVNADTNEDIARATGGFYINSEDDAELLRPFFLELLENALRFDTWQTINMTFDTIGPNQQQTIRFPVTSTTQAMTANVLWDRNLGRLTATLTPPGSSPISLDTGDGAARLSLRLPLDPPATARQDWVLEVRSAAGTSAKSIPYQAIVQGDDLGVHSELVVEPANYTPGDDIVVRARFLESGAPLTGLNGNGGSVRADIFKPGVPIGDLVASSTITVDPSGQDQPSLADAKLEKILEEDPEALEREQVPGGVQLRDNGNASNGDEIAGDGVYSGVLKAREPGHYNVVFAIGGPTERAGTVARVGIESIHVRSVPEENETQVDTTSTSQPGGGTRLDLVIEPKTKFGHAMVGFGPYIWVTASGVPPVQAKDNLDGTYSATLNFAGAVPGDVAVHFIETSTILTPSVTVDRLPEPLGGSTKLVDVNGAVSRKGWSAAIHLGANDPRAALSAFDGGLSAALDGEYGFNSRWAAQLFIGFDKFDDPLGLSDLDLFQVSLNGKAYFLNGSVRVFPMFGIGYYDSSPGSSDFGYNLGAGVQWDFGKKLALEGTVQYHVVGSSPSAELTTVLVGLRYRF